MFYLWTLSQTNLLGLQESPFKSRRQDAECPSRGTSTALALFHDMVLLATWFYAALLCTVVLADGVDEVRSQQAVTK